MLYDLIIQIHVFLLHNKFSISQNFNGICVKIVKNCLYKIHGLQSVKMA
jgi:hypothetical protein